MRFSLATLLLIALLAASLMAVWFRREAWYLDPTWYSSEKIQAMNPFAGESPDGTRNAWLVHSGNPTFYGIQDTRDRFDKYIYLIVPEPDYVFHTPAFLDDNTIRLQVPYELLSRQNEPSRLYRRRFPEWWWGHFYRPEVWACIVLGIGLLVRAWRSAGVKIKREIPPPRSNVV